MPADVLRDEDTSTSTWSASALHVRKAIAFIRRKGAVTAEDLVQWDYTHGGHLFDWNDISAAHEWRLQQARFFLNSFRRMVDGMRVRGYIKIRPDESLAIATNAYVSVEDIAQNRSMREQVVSDITRRMTMLASELRMWKLTRKEQRELFMRLREALSGS